MQGFDQQRSTLDRLQPAWGKNRANYHRFCSDLGAPARFRCESGTKRMHFLTNRAQSVLTWEFLGQIVRFLGIAGRGG